MFLKNFKFVLFGNPKFNLDWILFQIIFYIIDSGSVWHEKYF